MVVRDLQKGYIIGGLNNEPPEKTLSFVAQIIVLNYPGDIVVGYTPVVSCHTNQFSCKITEIHAIVDKKTGKMVELNPKSLKQGDAAIVVMQPTKAVCVEVFN